MRNALHLTISFLLLSAQLSFADGAISDKAPAFTLDDQHEKSHTFAYPREKPVVISVADPGGSKDAPMWTNAIKAKYGNRIEFWSMANLSFIPALGQGAARIGIRAVSKDVVLCDWDGAVSKKLGAPKGQANIIVISPRGEITHRAGGKPEPPKLAAAFNAIDALLPEPESDTPNEK